MVGVLDGLHWQNNIYNHKFCRYYGCQNESQCIHPKWLDVGKINLILQYFIKNRITSPYNVDIVMDIIGFILKALNLEFPMNKMNAINDIKLFKLCIYNTNEKKIYNDYGKDFKIALQNNVEFIRLSNDGCNHLSKKDLWDGDWYGIDRELMFPLLLKILDWE